LDILYFGFCQESIVSFVSKKEIEELPTIREVARFLQTILVDRSSPEARAKVKRDIEERVESFQKDRKNVFPLLIFP
jgi:1-acyl-sn-glycerol-3-phosphate acyltransferase